MKLEKGSATKQSFMGDHRLYRAILHWHFSWHGGKRRINPYCTGTGLPHGY